MRLLASTTTTVVSAPANPSVYGQSVTFTATVAANPPGSGTPTGTVQFQIDGTNFGSAVTLVSGSATSSAITTLSAAAHTIQAIYSGDTTFATSTGTLTQTVNPAALTITANNASKTYGQTATVRRHRVHDQRPGQRRHGQQRDRDQHGLGGDGGGRDLPHRAQRRDVLGGPEQQLHDHLRQRHADGQPGGARRSRPTTRARPTARRRPSPAPRSRPAAWSTATRSAA